MLDARLLLKSLNCSNVRLNCFMCLIGYLNLGLKLKFKYPYDLLTATVKLLNMVNAKRLTAAKTFFTKLQSANVFIAVWHRVITRGVQVRHHGISAS